MRIEVHGDQTLLAAVGKGQRRALDGGQLGADEIVAVVEDLLLAELVAGETDLDDGNGGSGIDGDQRRSGSRRQMRRMVCDNGGGLRQRGLHVGVRLEIDFDHRDAAEGLRFDVLDVVYQGGDGALGVGGDALLHVLRLEAGEVPHQADDRDVDVRENIRRAYAAGQPA